jgi:hypothetical protein
MNKMLFIIIAMIIGTIDINACNSAVTVNSIVDSFVDNCEGKGSCDIFVEGLLDSIASDSLRFVVQKAIIKMNYLNPLILFVAAKSNRSPLAQMDKIVSIYNKNKKMG